MKAAFGTFHYRPPPCSRTHSEGYNNQKITFVISIEIGIEISYVLSSYVVYYLAILVYYLAVEVIWHSIYLWIIKLYGMVFEKENQIPPSSQATRLGFTDSCQPHTNNNATCMSI